MTVILKNISELSLTRFTTSIVSAKMIKKDSVDRTIPMGITSEYDGQNLVLAANLIRLLVKSVKNLIQSIKDREVDLDFEQIVLIDK